MSKAGIYGNDIDTDVIIPARYLNNSNPDHLAAHCMEDLDSEFSKGVKFGDIIVGGKNFGCGSSREHAPLAIKATGVKVIIAESFGRIFFRNALNIGMPILECPEASTGIKIGDDVEVDLESGTIMNITKDELYNAHPFPPFIKELIRVGGLIPYVKEKKSNYDLL